MDIASICSAVSGDGQLWCVNEQRPSNTMIQNKP